MSTEKRVLRISKTSWARDGGVGGRGDDLGTVIHHDIFSFILQARNFSFFPSFTHCSHKLRTCLRACRNSECSSDKIPLLTPSKEYFTIKTLNLFDNAVIFVELSNYSRNVLFLLTREVLHSMTTRWDCKRGRERVSEAEGWTRHLF